MSLVAPVAVSVSPVACDSVSRVACVHVSPVVCVSVSPMPVFPYHRLAVFPVPVDLKTSDSDVFPKNIRFQKIGCFWKSF